MKKFIASALVLASAALATTAHAETNRVELSGLKNYPTVAEVRALEKTVITDKKVNPSAYIEVKKFDANLDGVIVLREVVDMINANFVSDDYSALDDIKVEDVQALTHLFNNVKEYI